MQLECPICRGGNAVAPPNSPGADVRLTRVHFKLGREEEAFQDAEAACRLGSEDACNILRRCGRDAGS